MCIRDSISFVGGGTDLPWFYSKHGGAVISTTIDKYVTVCVSRRDDPMIEIRTDDSREFKEHVYEIRQPIIRECLRCTDIIQGIEIEISSELGTQGTGLGTSSALTVGLLNALYAYKGIDPEFPAETLARQACEIEIDCLDKPIGKQDQYAVCLLYTSPSPRDRTRSRMPSSA